MVDFKSAAKAALTSACAVLLLQACTSSTMPFGLNTFQTAALTPVEVENPAETPTGPVTREAAILSYSAQPRLEIDRLINQYAMVYGVPERLVRSVVRRESKFNPDARNGPYYGLMQIHPQTAKTMGYRGAPEGLLDPDTNLKYAVKYLAGAYIVAGYNEAKANLLYQRGYYYDAKRQGLLEEIGLK